MFILGHCFLLLRSAWKFVCSQNKKPTSQFISGGGSKTLEAKIRLQKLSLPAPGDTHIQHIQHIQQIQCCAFLWGKIGMLTGYTGGGDLAIAPRGSDW